MNRKVKGRRHARLLSLMNGGTIPDHQVLNVISEGEGKLVGTLAEEFAVNTGLGDIFLLGNTAWRITGLEPGKVRVQPAPGQMPTVPFWEGESPGRSVEVSREVGELRAVLEQFAHLTRLWRNGGAPCNASFVDRLSCCACRWIAC